MIINGVSIPRACLKVSIAPSMMGVNPSAKKGLKYPKFTCFPANRYNKAKGIIVKNRKNSQNLAIGSMPYLIRYVDETSSVKVIMPKGVLSSKNTRVIFPIYAERETDQQYKYKKKKMQRSEPIILPAISRLNSTKVLSGNFRLNLVNINNAITTMEKPRISANQESGPAFSLTVRGSVINPTSNIAKNIRTIY